MAWGMMCFFQAVAFGLGASFLWTSEDGYF